VCGNVGDTISRVCTQDAASSPPNGVKFHSVTVVNDKAVKLSWQRLQDTNFWQYRIYKHTRFADTIMFPIQVYSSNSDTTFMDENVKVDENSYCYEVRTANQCGINSVSNTKSCSILLKGISSPIKNDINWTNYIYWQNGIKKYEIIRTEPFYAQLDSVLTSTSFKQERYTDEKWNYDNGVYDYKIRALEGLGGNDAFSESNTIELIQSPIVNVPNAYTPNGDNINDLWKAVPVFVKDFNLKLYNRWGEKLWETNDKKEFFSNKFSDKFSENEIAMNVLVYVITYSGWDGTVATKTGNVTLLR
jgi:gliding motility-associated-like protein